VEAHNYALKKPNSAMEEKTAPMERMKSRIAILMNVWTIMATANILVLI